MHLDSIKDLRAGLPKRPNISYKSEDLRTALKGVCDSLDNTGLPDWRGYITAKQTLTNYKSNGEYYSLEQKPISEPTYMAWIEEKIIREERIETNSRIVAVSDAFPQQTQGQSINEAVPEIGERRERRA